MRGGDGSAESQSWVQISHGNKAGKGWRGEGEGRAPGLEFDRDHQSTEGLVCRAEGFPPYPVSAAEGPGQSCILGRSRWAKYSSKCLVRTQNHSASSLPQSTQTTHGNEASLAWFAWHNSTSRKRICKNRSCHGRKPTSKQASVALGSGEARFCGQSPTLIPLPPHGFCGIVADLAHRTGPAPKGLTAQLLLVSAL